MAIFSATQGIKRLSDRSRRRHVPVRFRPECSPAGNGWRKQSRTGYEFLKTGQSEFRVATRLQHVRKSFARLTIFPVFQGSHVLSKIFHAGENSLPASKISCTIKVKMWAKWPTQKVTKTDVLCNSPLISPPGERNWFRPGKEFTLIASDLDSMDHMTITSTGSLVVDCFCEN